MPEDYPSFEINKNRERPYAHIQWKGTDVCMDIHCKCGADLHIDEEFCHHIKCIRCGAFYECSGFIELYEIDHEPESVKIPFGGPKSQ